MTFFDGYSYKVKNRALLILAVLLVAAAYKRSFSVTIETRKYHQELTAKLKRAEHVDSDIKQRQLEIARLNQYLGQENNSIEKVQQGFLNFYAQHAQNILVHQIDEVLNYKHPDFEINTHSIVLKGDFINTLKFIYTLEKEFKLAKLLNTQFEFKRTSNEQEEALYTTILIQNYLR